MKILVINQICLYAINIYIYIYIYIETTILYMYIIQNTHTSYISVKKNCIIKAVSKIE